MGWSGGSVLAEDIWNIFRRYVPVKSRKRVARRLVDIFEMEDCDTMGEAERLMKDAELGQEDEE